MLQSIKFGIDPKISRIPYPIPKPVPDIPAHLRKDRVSVLTVRRPRPLLLTPPRRSVLVRNLYVRLWYTLYKKGEFNCLKSQPL